MRPTTWANFLAVAVLAIASWQHAAAMGARAEGRSKAPAPDRSAPAATAWTVEGSWMKTTDEAVADALEKAAAVAGAHFAEQTPPLEWRPTKEFVREYMLGNLRESDAAFKKLGWEQAAEVRVPGPGALAQEMTREFKELGEMRRVCLRVEMTAKAREKALEQEQKYQAHQRQVRAEQRQGVLARALAGVVAALLAVAGYLRLEDATKGYYTTLLRLAAVGFVALVGAGVWLLT